MTDPLADSGLPDDLVAAFWRYERAVIDNDLDVLDDAFAPGESTMRGDHAGLLVSHDAISAFRQLRGGILPRSITRVETRVLHDDAVLTVSVARYDVGGTGLQTQLWQRIDGRWLIAAAHVTPRAQALDRTVWRSVGDPLWQGAWEGPLAGLTVAVKDLFAIRGYRIGAGNPTWLNEARPEHTTAPAVADLLRAGASIRGIARTDEFAYSIAGDNVHYGTPPNGAVPGALPGGSSNGPASAVATGQAEIALATDTAGSIRVPASYQGLWGLRTTHGLVPRQGLVPLSQSFDTIGWMTRDGQTLARTAEWCLGFDESATTDLSRPGSGLPSTWVVPEEILDGLEPGTLRALEDYLATVPSSIATIETTSIGDPDAHLAAFRILQGVEAWRNNGDWVRGHPGALGPAVAERFAIAAAVTADQEAEARGALKRLREDLLTLTTDAVIVMPTVPGPAPMRTATSARIDEVRHHTLRMTAPAAVGGLPSLSVPLLRVPSVLGPAPVGLCFTGRPESDLDLIHLGLRLGEAS